MSYVMGQVFHKYGVSSPYSDSIRHILNVPFFMWGNRGRGAHSRSRIQTHDGLLNMNPKYFFFLSFLSYTTPKRLKLTSGAFEKLSKYSFKKKCWAIYILSICWHLKNFLSLSCSEIPSEHCGLGLGCYRSQGLEKRIPCLFLNSKMKKI